MRTVLFTLCLSFLAFSFFSCSDSEADVVSVQATAVFDFEANDKPPVSRLAVFLQVTNAIQRTDSFAVSHGESGYSWLVSKPGIFTGMNKSYAYSVNLKPPESEAIPTGAYSVTYYDAAGKEDSMNFAVNYDSGLLQATPENFRDYLPNAAENVAIYDEEGELLFMGKTKNSWKTPADIQKDYKLAFLKRTCYVTAGNSVICLMPGEVLKESEKVKIEN